MSRDDEELIRRYVAGEPEAVAGIDDWIARAAPATGGASAQGGTTRTDGGALK